LSSPLAADELASAELCDVLADEPVSVVWPDCDDDCVPEFEDVAAAGFDAGELPDVGLDDDGGLDAWGAVAWPVASMLDCRTSEKFCDVPLLPDEEALVVWTGLGPDIRSRGETFMNRAACA
jgi:hypothetical protein